MNLSRAILALIITLCILPLCVSSFRMVSNIEFNYDEVNDELALNDLRRILLLAYDLDIKGYELDFVYQGKDYCLSLNNNRLVLSPGYQMFLNDVDVLSFKERHGCVFVRYERKNKSYERAICSAQRFYLDEFSNCDDEYNEYLDDQE